MSDKFRLVVFSLVPVLLLLAALEIVGRIIYPFDPDGRTRHKVERDPRITLSYFNSPVPGKDIIWDVMRMERRYYPSLGFLGAPNLNLPTVKTNEFGFRDGPIAPRARNEVRILLLGGSTAWGLGASSNAATVAGALEDLLNKQADGHRYRVMNGAFVSYLARQEMTVLTEFFHQFDPDLVISLTGYNDAVAVMTESSAILQRPEARSLGEAVANNLQPMGTLDAAKKVFGSLGVWRIVVYFREMNAARNPAGGKRSYDIKRSESAVPRIADMHRISAEYLTHYGRKYMVAVQPDIYVTDKKLTQEEARVRDRFTVRFEGVTEAYSRYRSDMVAALQRQNGFRVVDLKTVFDPVAEPVFIDDCHLNDRGYLEISKAIQKELRTL